MRRELEPAESSGDISTLSNLYESCLVLCRNNTNQSVFMHLRNPLPIVHSINNLLEKFAENISDDAGVTQSSNLFEDVNPLAIYALDAVPCGNGNKTEAFNGWIKGIVNNAPDFKPAADNVNTQQAQVFNFLKNGYQALTNEIAQHSNIGLSINEEERLQLQVAMLQRKAFVQGLGVTFSQKYEAVENKDIYRHLLSSIINTGYLSFIDDIIIKRIIIGSIGLVSQIGDGFSTPMPGHKKANINALIQMNEYHSKIFASYLASDLLPNTPEAVQGDTSSGEAQATTTAVTVGNGVSVEGSELDSISLMLTELKHVLKDRDISKRLNYNKHYYMYMFAYLAKEYSQLMSGVDVNDVNDVNVKVSSSLSGLLVDMLQSEKIGQNQLKEFMNLYKTAKDHGLLKPSRNKIKKIPARMITAVERLLGINAEKLLKQSNVKSLVRGGTLSKVGLCDNPAAVMVQKTIDNNVPIHFRDVRFIKALAKLNHGDESCKALKQLFQYEMTGYVLKPNGELEKHCIKRCLAGGEQNRLVNAPESSIIVGSSYADVTRELFSCDIANSSGADPEAVENISVRSLYQPHVAVLTTALKFEIQPGKDVCENSYKKLVMDLLHLAKQNRWSDSEGNLERIVAHKGYRDESESAVSSAASSH